MRPAEIHQLTVLIWIVTSMNEKKEACLACRCRPKRSLTLADSTWPLATSDDKHNIENWKAARPPRSNVKPALTVLPDANTGNLKVVPVGESPLLYETKLNFRLLLPWQRIGIFYEGRRKAFLRPSWKSIRLLALTQLLWWNTSIDIRHSKGHITVITI